MKTMSDYTVYCTEEQTKRAKKLGAPIKENSELRRDNNSNSIIFYDGLEKITTQQMIGWLRENGIIDLHTCSCNIENTPYYYSFINGGKIYGQVAEYHTQEEAELAAIDAALDYLEKGK